jgi:hypothetical protein
MSAKETAVAVAAAGAVGLVLYSVLKSEATEAAKAVGRAIDPTSDQNVFYRGVNALGSSVTGDKHFTLGGWLYDLVNPDLPK